MEKRDARAVPHVVREEIRKRAVRQVLAGESPRVVIAGLGFHRSCNSDWPKQYQRRYRVERGASIESGPFLRGIRKPTANALV